MTSRGISRRSMDSYMGVIGSIATVITHIHIREPIYITPDLELARTSKYSASTCFLSPVLAPS